MKKIYFVSSNQGKREELKQILENSLIKSGYSLEFIELDIPEIQGSGLEVIQEKTLSCASLLKEILICEDSSLCFKAWNDFPGVYM
jgi:inosine triphosphate pyrophosphatase